MTQRTLPAMTGFRGRVGGALAMLLAVELSGCATSTPPALRGVPSTATVRGHSVPYEGPQAWTVASIPARDGRVVTVFATGSDAIGGGPCGPPAVRLQAVETPEAVRIRVSDYEEPAGPGQACPAIGYLPGPQRIRLRTPLGDRRLVDASTGKTPELLIGTDYPDLVAPPGSEDGGLLERMNLDGPVQRLWTYPDGRVLRLQIVAPSYTRTISPYGRTARQVDLDGSPAMIYATGGPRYGSFDVVWTPNPRQTLLVLLSNSPKGHWNLDQAESIARSVRGYTTTRTGRLPQPASPGTAAAVYNSADGPVLHAENVFKSSGIFIAVNCQGRGTTTVTFRGTAYPVACRTRLTRAVRFSRGAPEQSSVVSITADPGVRWAVTLARASLDGS